MDPLLIATRVLHFAGALSLVGVLGFAAFVADLPSPRLARQLRVAGRSSAALLLLTAPLWLILVAENMSAEALPATISHGVPRVVLLDTQFGRALGLRFVLTLVLLPLLARLGKDRVLDRAAVLLAAVSVAAIAWQGHAGDELGRDAVIHLTADAAHLLAAGLWLGALLPLMLLLRDTIEIDQRYEAAKRFSMLGVICVAALLPSGIVNAYYLVGSVPALIGTVYGQILLLKLVIVLAMLALATVNRGYLVPRLAARDDHAARRLARHSGIEALLGLGVIAIVAVLGTMEPALHEPVVWPFGAVSPADSSPAMPADHMHQD
ncbi:MAG TPA: copper homeostasis membrane protein CopD [Stellaceae bacterium]|jgi:putative copper resistance protein D